ncbi:uncharacterized protein LOC126825410 isoform X2 [Patella vulgata]|uniref:uncharacterized protein LOC126825410 isoform X2 n=1 Tax=Patella vulgata TaxID=6465 RepID=UPI00218050A9|nr:uncharacterized protein LOC126825410 isoform X2 [Patella vulgata]
MGFQILGCIVFFICIQCNQSLDPLCTSSVQGCVMSFQTGVQQVGGNATETCKQVDIFIACLDRVLQPCDLATRSSLLSAMDNLINNYERAPYSCTLESKDNVTLSDCTLEIGNCAAYDLQAKSTTDNSRQACSYHEIYKTCMAENTTTCNGTDRDDINEALTNSTTIMTDCPFNCYGEKQCESTTVTIPDDDLTGNPNDTQLPLLEGSVTQYYSDNDIEASITIPDATQNVNLGHFATAYTYQSMSYDPRNNFTTPSSNPSRTSSRTRGTSLTPSVEEEQTTPKNGDNKHTPTKPIGGKPNTNAYPFRTSSILRFTTKESTRKNVDNTERSTVNWDNYGNNGAAIVSYALFLLVVSTLIAVMFRN